jgi:predicted Zn-dependent peptidase
MASTFVEHELPSGLRVICEVMPRVRSAAAALLCRTGARDERPPEHGVSHFLEHMCFKGTPTRSSLEINVRFDELGAIYNAFTGKEHTVYYGWVPAPRISAQIELLADMMRPSLPRDDFEMERKVILEEIAMNDDSFDHIVWNCVHENVFGTHVLAHEILGEKETIANLPHEALLDYHRRRYAPNNLCLLAAGAVEPEEIFAAAGRYCGEWPAQRNGASQADIIPAVVPSGVRSLKLERFKQQSVVLVYPGVAHNHPTSESVEAFTSLFGGHNSRCYWNIVQKGICTEAGAAWVSYRDCGLLVLFADGEPERCEEMLAALRREAEDVMRGGFRAEEVQRVKNQRRTTLALEAESPRTRVMQLVDDLETRGYVQTPDARTAAVEAVTTETIAEYLATYPITGQGLLLVCGPRAWPN